MAEEKKPEGKVHKSLAEILGIPKRGEPIDQPKVAVVIDPKIAKVLRPHQIEGVKVQTALILCLMVSFFIKRRPAKFTTVLLDVSWQMRWVLGKRYSVAGRTTDEFSYNVLHFYGHYSDNHQHLQNERSKNALSHVLPLSSETGQTN